MHEEVCFIPAAELTRKIRGREFSPVEVVDAFLARIEERNPEINAYVTLLGDGAREAASAAERALYLGGELGPLHGVPVAIKDLSDHKAGVRSTYGSKPLAAYVPDRSVPYVERLEAAGAIILGKTNTPEFGIKGATDNLLFGPTRNPFDLEKNAGGSSGGSAAAVADGLAAVAQGTDGGGSVRIPASFCGVYGLKTTFGRVPVAARPDAFGWHTPFIDVGPLARTVEDAAIMLGVMAGSHPRDPHALPGGGPDYRAALRHPVEGLRIAYSPDLGCFPVEEEILSVVGEAALSLAEAGAKVEEVEIDLGYPQRELSSVWVREIAVRCAASAANFKAAGVSDLAGEQRGDLTPEFAALLDLGSGMRAVDYKLDDVVRTGILDAFEDLFERYDLLVSPTLAVPPFENADDGNTTGPTRVNGEMVDPLIGWCLTYPANFTGHPAASVPAGFTRDGLPVGMQLVGRRFDEATVIAVSATLERTRPWSGSYPPRSGRAGSNNGKRG